MAIPSVPPRLCSVPLVVGISVVMGPVVKMPANNNPALLISRHTNPILPETFLKMCTQYQKKKNAEVQAKKVNIIIHPFLPIAYSLINRDAGLISGFIM